MRTLRGVRILAGLALIGGLAAAQQRGGTTGGGSTTTAPPTTGGGGSRGGSTGTTTIPNTGNNTQTQTPSQPQVIFITGAVALDDGTAPPTTVVIERVCATRTYREGYADTKGHFSLQLGQSTGVFQDASADSNTVIQGLGGVGGGLGGNNGDSPFNSNSAQGQLWGCEIRAVLAGYRSDTIPLTNRRAMDNPDIGTIVLHYFGNVQGLTTSATTALAPKEARKSYERGTKALQADKPDEAQKELLKAVTLYPKFAEAWVGLGRVYERRNHKEEAREAYAKAIGADGNLVSPYERLYLMAFTENKWQDVAEGSDKVLRLNPYDFPGAYYVNAVANYQLQKYDAAEKSAREAAKLTGKQAEPRSQFVLGLTLAQKGDFVASGEALRTYLKLAPPGINVEQVTKTLADVDRLAQAKATAAENR